MRSASLIREPIGVVFGREIVDEDLQIVQHPCNEMGHEQNQKNAKCVNLKLKMLKGLYSVSYLKCWWIRRGYEREQRWIWSLRLVVGCCWGRC